MLFVHTAVNVVVVIVVVVVVFHCSIYVCFAPRTAPSYGSSIESGSA
jgi:hypothetical protein